MRFGALHQLFYLAIGVDIKQQWLYGFNAFGGLPIASFRKRFGLKLFCISLCVPLF